MSSKLDKAIEALRKLPEEDQEAAAEGLLAYASRSSAYRLTREQEEELRRRLAGPLEVLTDAEAEAFFSRLMA